jgi:hypothetical protein
VTGKPFGATLAFTRVRHFGPAEVEPDFGRRRDTAVEALLIRFVDERRIRMTGTR